MYSGLFVVLEGCRDGPFGLHISQGAEGLTGCYRLLGQHLINACIGFGASLGFSCSSAIDHTVLLSSPSTWIFLNRIK